MAKKHSATAVKLSHVISDSDWKECATSSISHTVYYSAAQNLDDGARQRLVSVFVANSDLREDFKELWNDLSSAKVKTIYLPFIFVDASAGASHTRQEAKTLYWSGNTEFYTMVDVIERGYGANNKRSLHPVLQAMRTREAKEARGTAEFDTILWSEAAFNNARNAALWSAQESAAATVQSRVKDIYGGKPKLDFYDFESLGASISARNAARQQYNRELNSVATTGATKTTVIGVPFAVYEKTVGSKKYRCYINLNDSTVYAEGEIIALKVAAVARKQNAATAIKVFNLILVVLCVAASAYYCAVPYWTFISVFFKSTAAAFAIESGFFEAIINGIVGIVMGLVGVIAFLVPLIILVLGVVFGISGSLGHSILVRETDSGKSVSRLQIKIIGFILPLLMFGALYGLSFLFSFLSTL